MLFVSLMYNVHREPNIQQTWLVQVANTPGMGGGGIKKNAERWI
jgi:hypothetical protein